MYIKKYDQAVIKEFDSLDELREFDENYLTNTHSPIFKNICKILHCQESEISHIRPIKIGLTNLSFLFDCRVPKYVYRHPGTFISHTDKTIFFYEPPLPINQDTPS